MIILHDSDTLLHETVEFQASKITPALESPARIEAIVAALSKSQHTLQIIKSPQESRSDLNILLDLIQRTHGEDYLDHLRNVFTLWRDANLVKQHESILPECFVFPNKAHATPQAPKDIFARAGFFAFDMSSGIMEHTYKSIVASVNLALEAVRKLRDDPEVKEVVALCRPPGHHCNGHRAGGYCYVNNAAVAVSTWREYSPDTRIGILDIDFHHGNGTQDIFYADPKVFYTSIHGEDEYPYYTGNADETGTGDAAGTNLNLPLKTGSSFEEYLEKLELALEALSIVDPKLLVVSLGFDTFHLDPIGSFKIDTEDYEELARKVKERLPDVPAVILLEGGYAVEHLGGNLLSFLSGWERRA